jgi:hypothetical protein
MSMGYERVRPELHCTDNVVYPERGFSGKTTFFRIFQKRKNLESVI